MPPFSQAAGGGNGHAAGTTGTKGDGVEQFELDQRDLAHAPVKGYPVWWTRKWIGPYELDDEQIRSILETEHLAVVSWVTARSEPVTALVDYVYLDGFVTVTSTTNRAKFKAWSRNPAACFCIWNSKNTQQCVNLRGRVEIFQDEGFHRRWIRGLLENNLGTTDIPDELFESQFRLFDAPDRHYMRLHVEKVVSYDGGKLRRAEREGLDLWGVAGA